MKQSPVILAILFEIVDVFGKRIRTTQSYWHKIIAQKHTEFTYTSDDVITTLTHPDSVYQSVTDDTIALYRKEMKDDTMIVVAKHLNGEGFIVTVYQTTKTKVKGTQLWPKT